jgi:hypothetical protein
MPQGSKTQSTKKRTGKLGRNSDVKGGKLAFLESHQEEFVEAQEVGLDVAGKFYTKMTRLWLLKYGYDLAFSEDNEDCDEPDEHLAGERLDWSDLPEEEMSHRKGIYGKTQEVCWTFIEKNKCRKLTDNQAPWELVSPSL